MRVSQLFARRGYNIQSLAVGPTERDDISRLTLRVDCSEHSLEQIEKQMHKLVNVLRVTELRPEEAVERELALVTVASPPDSRADLLAAALAAGATSPTSATTRSRSRSSAGRTTSTRSSRSSIRYGVRELARTGRIGLRRPHTKTEPQRKGLQWLRSSRPETSACSPERSPCSATAARATRTRSTSPTPASRSRSASARAAPRARPPRKRG